ncbi:hypothetical protein RBB50_004219 [Rhinocladiella similis]
MAQLIDAIHWTLVSIVPVHMSTSPSSRPPPGPTIWIQSATPALNRPSDLTRYFTLWWKDQFLTDLEKKVLFLRTLRRRTQSSFGIPSRSFIPSMSPDVAKYHAPPFMSNTQAFASLCNQGRMQGQGAGGQHRPPVTASAPTDSFLHMASSIDVAQGHFIVPGVSIDPVRDSHRVASLFGRQTTEAQHAMG